MNSTIRIFAAGSMLLALAGCAHRDPVVDVQTAAVSDVLNDLRDQLAAFADAAPQKAFDEKSVCGDGFRLEATTATVTLTAVGARQTDTSVGLAVPLLDLSAKGSAVDKNTTKIVLPLTIVNEPGKKSMRAMKDMELASALLNLRDELIKARHDSYPCFRADKGIKLGLTFEVVRSGTGGFTLNVAPIKAGATFSTSATTSQAIEVDLGIVGKDGKPTLFGNPGKQLLK